MSNIDWNRLVVVTATHGEKYIGFLPEGGKRGPKDYVENCAYNGAPLILEDARNLISQMSPNLSPRGDIIGFSKMLLLSSIDVLSGPMPKIHILISSWWFPEENEPSKKKIEELLKQATETEARLSAAEAGLHVPGPRIAQ